jgi:hypothetical protein
MRGAQVAAVVAVFAIVAAACGGTSVETTGDVGSTGAATSTTAAAPTTTAAAPATTAAFPSTTAAVTTTSTPADEGTFFVVSGVCPLGWWDGDWESGDTLPVTGGEEYQVVRLDEPITTATGSAPTTTCDPLQLTSVLLEPTIATGPFEIDPIAIQTAGNVRPREVALLELDQQVYVDATASLLQSRGVADPVVNVEQVIRTDLEGDGDDEVIVAASTLDPADFTSAAIGDSSVVFLRKVVEGEVQTAVLAEVIVTSLDQVPFGVARYRVSAIADLNGDGKTEIVLSSESWEGASLEAWEYVDDDLGAVRALSCGCGA